MRHVVFHVEHKGMDYLQRTIIKKPRVFAVWFIIFALITGVLARPEASSAQVVQNPFPHHTLYAAGAIKPDRMSQSGMDSVTGRFYRAWKKHYLAETPDHKYYVYCNADGNWHGGNKSVNSISLSEGNGYGMLITVLMAGYDPQAQIIFDGMVAYFKAHPSNINPHLMAWDQTSDSVINTHNSDDATDGDLDIAYALLMADRQWGSGGRYNYKKEAIAVIDALMKTNVSATAHLMLMGDWTEQGEPYYNATRPSDIMPTHFKAFAGATGDSAWLTVCNNSYRMLRYLQSRYSRASGLFPDFVKQDNRHPRPAGPYYMEIRKDGDYSYNACRVPFRLACDFLLNDDPRAKELLQPINHCIIKKCRYDPYRVVDGYTLQGHETIGASTDNIAFIGTFGVAAMTDAKNQVWLNRIWDYATHEPLTDEEYYGNTLKLLCLITMSGNMWGI